MTFCNNGVTIVNAKNPYTIVGMPANTSNAGLMMRRVRSDAYSLK